MCATHVEILNTLSDEIAAARGLQLAIIGEASVRNFEPFPLTELCEQHITRLEALRERIDKHNGEAGFSSPCDIQPLAEAVPAGSISPSQGKLPRKNRASRRAVGTPAG